MIAEVEHIYDNLQDMCWETTIFRYMYDEIGFDMEWFVKNEKKVYEWWNKLYSEFSSDLNSVWDDAESMAKQDLEEEGYDEDEITDRMVNERAQNMAELLYNDLSDKWEDLIKLVDFRDDSDLIWKVGRLEDDIDDCYKTVNEEMPDLIKEKIRDIFED